MEAIPYSVRDGLENSSGKVASFWLLLLIQQIEPCSVFLAYPAGKDPSIYAYCFRSGA